MNGFVFYFFRPTSTRGRGHAHYSTQNGGDATPVPQSANRGTPPTLEQNINYTMKSLYISLFFYIFTYLIFYTSLFIITYYILVLFLTFNKFFCMFLLVAAGQP